MLFKIGVLKNFAIFSDLQPSNFIKERIRHRIFPVNNAKFLRKHFFFSECLLWLLLYVVWAKTCAMLSQPYLGNIDLTVDCGPALSEAAVCRCFSK